MPSQLLDRITATVAALIVTIAVGAASEQSSTAARLRQGSIPAALPRAFGGGEVVLELTVDSDGAVAQIERVRMTPPYLDFMVNAVSQWRFTPARTVIDKRLTPVAAPVLVVAVFRPPLVYGWPAPAAPSQALGGVSRRAPSVAFVTLPAYPPRAVGDGIVIVEIEMSRQAEPRHCRIIGARSGFDNAALDAVRAWRFAPPQAPDLPEPIFAYAVLGFRELITLPGDQPGR